MTFSAHNTRTMATGGLVGLGLLLLLTGFWIPVKAAVAQVLLEGAWARAEAGAETPRPWPWAETWPVARLEIAQVSGTSAEASGARGRQAKSLIVLAGADGESLPFGPGHVSGSAAPGSSGNVVLAAHRDTHFRFLKHLRPGDELTLRVPGRAVTYRVSGFEVVHESNLSVLEPADEATLTLVTCWPFDSLVPGGEWRYVVKASSRDAALGGL
jgi:sortase A